MMLGHIHVKILLVLPWMLLCVTLVFVVSNQDISVLDGASSISDAAFVPFDLREALSFLPLGNRDCDGLKETLTPIFQWPEGFKKTEKEHEDTFRKYLLADPKRPEGHSGQQLEQKMVYMKLVQLPFVKTVCETGFNGGHSTLVWLAANPNTKVYSFDNADHEYAEKMAQHLQAKYPGRLTVTWGFSEKTLPKFAEEHPEVKCDLIIVDGGHTFEVATEDFLNFRNMANPKNIVVFDDHPTKNNRFQSKLARAWETQIRSGLLAEQFACEKDNHRGFSLGHFIMTGT
ncbi:hypothetical protein CAPTEDRAFT_221703 [Capitella teleta]|uniref:Methyltransferase domain-containing protein n=1 Tax=Capitella teleta TaxID=283909 RepID=R7TMC6_CAPTE|nr:hypothetical protein CAPTEDRAFT_221703 [Capitella teleta]|eukprot:ELT92235.1 hypothetical protein CAPTEDRAFT_221703 [Capitella teleta]